MTTNVVHRDIKPGNIMLSGGTRSSPTSASRAPVSAAGGDQLTQTGTRDRDTRVHAARASPGSGQWIAQRHLQSRVRASTRRWRVSRRLPARRRRRSWAAIRSTRLAAAQDRARRHSGRARVVIERALEEGAGPIATRRRGVRQGARGRAHRCGFARHRGAALSPRAAHARRRMSVASASV